MMNFNRMFTIHHYVMHQYLLKELVTLICNFGGIAKHLT